MEQGGYGHGENHKYKENQPKPSSKTTYSQQPTTLTVLRIFSKVVIMNFKLYKIQEKDNFICWTNKIT